MYLKVSTSDLGRQELLWSVEIQGSIKYVMSSIWHVCFPAATKGISLIQILCYMHLPTWISTVLKDISVGRQLICILTAYSQHTPGDNSVHLHMFIHCLIQFFIHGDLAPFGSHSTQLRFLHRASRHTTGSMGNHGLLEIRQLWWHCPEAPTETGSSPVPGHQAALHPKGVSRATGSSALGCRNSLFHSLNGRREYQENLAVSAALTQKASRQTFHGTFCSPLSCSPFPQCQ